MVSYVCFARSLFAFCPQGAGVDLKDVTVRDDIAPYNRSDLDALLAGEQVVPNVTVRI